MAVIDEFDLVFGPDSSGRTAPQRARTSHRIFVRSQDELAVYRDGATGRRLTAWEAFSAFGYNKLLEAVTHSSAILVSDLRKPASVLRDQRERLGLEIVDIARRLGVSQTDVLNAENPNKRASIHFLERVAQALGLDETKLTDDAHITDPALTVRLRQLRSTRPEFTANTVLSFDEAAWVSFKQTQLIKWIKPDLHTLPQLGFEADSRYGDRQHKAWWWGYRLAAQSRELLRISPTDPIRSLRELAENRLNIPLIQTLLPADIAGATVSNMGTRGIIVNTSGNNRNVWVRRSTIAHELGHLLWDPDQHLKQLRVDSYRDFEEMPLDVTDHVEARANAFAIEFLAPQQAVRQIFQQEENSAQAIRKIMETFGVSFTSAKYQIWNSLERTIPLSSLATEDVEPTDEWNAAESYTLDFFKPESVADARKGSFSGIVVAAQRRGLISSDSAAALLGCTEHDYLQSANFIASVHPVTIR